ncbi:MAG: translation initiation factor [Cyanobium sp. M30B3]|jgi:translation initiation factor 1|nr:MAG: translation initiation factor [Cyanobium sp. M30B3]
MAKKGGWQEFAGASSAASLARPSTAPPATPRAQQQVRVQRTKAGKGGKLVTAITGLELPEAEARSLLKQLKASAGTGGTLKDGVIELQGDQVAAALAALERAGFRPRQAGG